MIKSEENSQETTISLQLMTTVHGLKLKKVIEVSTRKRVSTEFSGRKRSRWVCVCVCGRGHDAGWKIKHTQNIRVVGISSI